MCGVALIIAKPPFVRYNERKLTAKEGLLLWPGLPLTLPGADADAGTRKNWRRISAIVCCFIWMAASGLSGIATAKPRALVFSVWGHGIDADGKLLWDREPEFESQQTALPRYLTDVQEDGKALQFDGARKRYILTEEFDEDKLNGYSKFKVFWMKRKK